MQDDCALTLSTSSTAAVDAYVEGVTRLLCAQPGIETALQDALHADPQFALAHAALARAHQLHARPQQARAAMAQALALIDQTSARERGHIQALSLVLQGDADRALTAIREHLEKFPRDRMVMAPCVGVFGLFGFSGLSGREQALDAFFQQYESACRDDWWFLAVRAFAQCETGQLGLARQAIERSLQLRSDNANAAHIHMHVAYEDGERTHAFTWLTRWLQDYDRAGLMHCHLSWHLALCALENGDDSTAWRVIDAQVQPDVAWGPPLNVLTDTASFLLRAELSGMPRETQRWQRLARYALAVFPQPTVTFAEMHVLLALTMSGQDAAASARADGARAPAADLLPVLNRAWMAFAQGDDAEVLRQISPMLASHERLGGSRAQRDLLEHVAWVAATHLGQDPSMLRSRGIPLPHALRQPSTPRSLS